MSISEQDKNRIRKRLYAIFGGGRVAALTDIRAIAAYELHREALEKTFWEANLRWMDHGDHLAFDANVVLEFKKLLGDHAWRSDPYAQFIWEQLEGYEPDEG